MTKDEVKAAFAEMVAREDQEIELDRSALLIAAEEYPLLDVEKYLLKLDAYADRARILDDPGADPLSRILRLNDLLFNDLGFHGNSENYFDARNSFLNDCIDRRTGIPITLSVIYLEIARRIRLELSGVGLPGHFIVKHVDRDGVEMLIDPFNGGRILTEATCRELLSDMFGGAVQFHPLFLRPITKRQLLARMLQNLKGIYQRAADHHKTLSVIERLLMLNPGSPVEIRDRGMVNASLERYSQALADLEEYLRLAPQAEDVKKVKEKLGALLRKRAELN